MIAASELVSADALSRYDDSGEPALYPAERILLRLRWWGREWCSREELVDALEVGPHDRWAIDKALERLAAEGRVERIGRFGRAAFRLGVVRTPRRVSPGRAAKNATRRTWRARQRELGLCVDCSEKAAPGKPQCARHSEIAQRRYQKGATT